MLTKTSKMPLSEYYERMAQEYLRKLPLEHFMESTPQSTQRKITLESLDLVTARRPDAQVFSELLVQYPLPRRKRPGQVVPDNMVVIHAELIDAVGSYDIPLQPVGPFWVLEYVSKGNRRKDYKDNLRRYDRDLQVPYYLLFEPDRETMTLYHHNGARYVKVKPDAHGRCAIAELELQVGLLAGWVRFWHRGELLPLPGELMRDLETTQEKLAAANERANDEKRRADNEKRRADAAEKQLAELRLKLGNGRNGGGHAS